MFDSPSQNVLGGDTWRDGEVHFVGQCFVVAAPDDETVTVFEDASHPKPLHRCHVAFADRKLVTAQIDGGAGGMVTERCLRVVLLWANLPIVVSPHRQRLRVDVGDVTVERGGDTEQNRCRFRTQVYTPVGAWDAEPFDVDCRLVGADRPAVDRLLSRHCRHRTAASTV